MLLNAQQIEEKIQSAHQAFYLWRDLSVSDRGRRVHKLASLLQDRQDQFAKLISRLMGKHPDEAQREVDRCVKACQSFPELAKNYLRNEDIVSAHRRSYVCYQPLGLILGITPWNFPLWQLLRFAIPNLLAGNVVLLKHAPNVFECAKQVEALMIEAGFPQGVFQHLEITEQDVALLIADARIQGVSLTGSVRAGKAVASLAGQHLKKVVLELGGSDSFIVLEDADLDLAVRSAVQARYMNSGQICVAAKRMLVHEACVEDFSRKLVDAVKTLPVLAPLARKDLCDQLAQQVNDSIQQGAVVLLGGKRSPENPAHFQATVLSKVQSGMPVFQQETFGPVSCITSFATDEQAIALANASDYGLGATVWTRNTARGEQLALKIEAGMVYVNSLLRSEFSLPFGGIKHSGLGRELGREGFREFTNIKTVVLN